jgi:hypothetical protein
VYSLQSGAEVMNEWTYTPTPPVCLYGVGRDNFFTVILTSRWAGHVARMGEKKGAYRILVGRSEGRRPLRRPRRRWEDNIKMDLQEMGWSMDWIELAQDRDRWRALVNAVMKLRVP